jgi:hypothetical protein
VGVAIYLDANILWSWRTFEEVNRLALSIVAHQIGQQVFVPEVAAREAEETYRRSLQTAIARYDTAMHELRRKFDEDFAAVLEPQPCVPAAVDGWKTRLAELADVIPTEPVDAVEALEREIVGRAPAKARAKEQPGAGARDAAIWLTVLRHHREMDEPGAFITKNSEDFAKDGELKPALRAELEGYEQPLTVYLSLERFIESLGQPTDGPEIGLEELRQLAEPTLKDTLEHRPDVSAAYWNRLEPHLRYATRLKTAQPIRIRAQHRYEREGEAVSLVDAEWELLVEPCFQDVDTETPETWTCLEGSLEVTARIQLFVPERDARERAELITGRWSSRTSLFMRESGEVTSLTEVGRGFGDDEAESIDDARWR